MYVCVWKRGGEKGRWVGKEGRGLCEGGRLLERISVSSWFSWLKDREFGGIIQEREPSWLGKLILGLISGTKMHHLGGSCCGLPVENYDQKAPQQDLKTYKDSWKIWLYCICVCVCARVQALVAQSCPTLCDPMDWSLPDSSVHGIFQARILEWVAISFSRFYFAFDRKCSQTGYWLLN